MPQVSVIVPNYNHAPYLEKRFDSIFAQTYQDFELIILDDCSTDNSRKVLEKYRNHPKVSQVFYNEQNSGSTFKQWNKGVALAKGEYIWIAESDDEAEPEFLETLVPQLEKNQNVGIAYCESLLINDKSEEMYSAGDWSSGFDKTHWSNDFVVSGIEECSKYMILFNSIPNASAVLFRKNIFHKAGGASINMKLCGDWMTWMNMLIISDLAFSSSHLNLYRWHDKSIRLTVNHAEICKEYFILKSSFLKKININKNSKKWIQNELLMKWQKSIYEDPKNCSILWFLDIFLSALKFDFWFYKKILFDYLKMKIHNSKKIFN